MHPRVPKGDNRGRRQLDPIAVRVRSTYIIADTTPISIVTIFSALSARDSRGDRACDGDNIAGCRVSKPDIDRRVVLLREAGIAIVQDCFAFSWAGEYRSSQFDQAIAKTSN